MKDRLELRFAGSGGQGVILASVITAEAAVLAGLHTAQSQAYGPEARGGVSRAETILSREQIWYTRVTHPDFLLALTQTSLDAYAGQLADDAIVMIDDSLTVPAELDPDRVIAIPILHTAETVVGRAFTANIVSLGAINRLLGLFDDDTLLTAVKMHIPRGTEDLNRTALQAGAALITTDQFRKEFQAC